MRRIVNARVLTLLAVTVVIALVVQAAPSGTVVAEIPPDCRFWGPVTVCGKRVEAGTEITVRILDPETGPSWTTTTVLWGSGGVPYYVIDIPPEDFPEPGGVDGDTVYFTVTGVTYQGSFIPAELSGPHSTWRRAGSVYHPLRVGTPGDANLDGVVNAADIVRVQKIIAGQEPPTPCADANQDGLINAADIIRILKIIAEGP